MDFRVVDFLNFTLRLRLSRSVGNLPLTSSLALLDSTLPKIRHNDDRVEFDKTNEGELALRRSRLLFFLVSWISFTKTSRSFHYVSTHFCFCNFGTTLPLRPTEIRWGTRYSFPSCKNIHRMFLLRQSLIGKKRKNNGYEMVNINNTLALFNNKILK